jgi:hypothetical protein
VEKCPVGSRLEFSPPKRTLSQNARMWAMLTDIASQTKAEVLVRGQWMRVKRSTEWWKLFFLASLGLEREQARDPSDHSTLVSFDRNSSSALGKDEFSDLIELMFAFGARAQVEWSDPAILQEPARRITHVQP